jgi:hypothetical protein
MPYNTLSEKLPGITGLLDYRKDRAQPIRELTQILLRGPSTLTEGERELIGTVVVLYLPIRLFINVWGLS